MKNSQKVIATLVIVGTLGTATAFAATDEMPTKGNADNPRSRNEMSQRVKQMPSAEIIEAIESGNYDAWVALHDGRNNAFTDAITADNFGKLQEMHEARQNQDVEAAKAIAEELGLPAAQGRMGDRSNAGDGQGKPGVPGNGQRSNMKTGPSAEIIEAVESGNYDAWVALHDGRNNAFTDAITEGNFGKLQEMHEARQNEDFESAKAIAEELGLPSPQDRMGNRGNGNGQRPDARGLQNQQ
jgi:transcriptional regulator of met regulon